MTEEYTPELDQFAPMVQRLVYTPIYLYWGVEEGGDPKRFSIAYYLHLDEPWLRGRSVRLRRASGRAYHLGLARRGAALVRDLDTNVEQIKRWSWD